VAASALEFPRREGRNIMSKGHTPQSGVRITNQFRKREAMVYDLACEDVRLTLEVTQRPGDDGLGEWFVEAHARQAVERPTIQQPGVTRKDALSAVAIAWRAKEGAYGFPQLDWDGVSAAMLSIRAI
jgi:hypothetical protein